MQSGFGNKQSGAALIMFALVLMLVITTFILSILDGRTLKVELDKKTDLALAEAKVAIIGYSTAAIRPGMLPCPDTNNDGITDPNGTTDCYSRIGRLPWKTLGLDDIRDGNGERLWYALSANFAYVPSSSIINSDDTNGLLNVCPTSGCGDPSPIPSITANLPPPMLSRQVAIIFASGTALTGQDRKDGIDTNQDPSANIDNAKKSINYLDTLTTGLNLFNNATGSNNGNDFTVGFKTDSFNDRLLSISTEEIFSNVDKRMQARETLSEIASCLIEYAKNNATATDKRLPWPAPLVQADYIDMTKFDDDTTRFTGRIAYKIDTSTSGSPIHGWNTGVATKKQKMEYCSTWPVWWNSWKKNVFYAVSKAYAPDATIAPQSCSGNCVSVDGIGPYAAILIFSGKKLAGQNRSNSSDIADSANYLEDKNALAIAGNTGLGDFTSQTSSMLNDVLVCIRQNLTIDLTCTTP